MEISGPRIGLRAMQLETVLAHVSQQLITCGRVRKHLTVRPEVGAVCEKDACPDLCGGREVTCVPTATAPAANVRQTPKVVSAPCPRDRPRTNAVSCHAPPPARGHGALTNAAVCNDVHGMRAFAHPTKTRLLLYTQRRRSWHIGGYIAVHIYLRCWGITGLLLLSQSISAYDP